MVVAPLTRSVDWNRLTLKAIRIWVASLLSRGAWIEIVFWRKWCYGIRVAPLTRSVDWNKITVFVIGCKDVAPLTRSVDWNALCYVKAEDYHVAPLTRSVDWNALLLSAARIVLPSLLSRGAWIEILWYWGGQKWKRRSSHEERGLKLCRLHLS